MDKVSQIIKKKKNKNEIEPTPIIKQKNLIY